MKNACWHAALLQCLMLQMLAMQYGGNANAAAINAMQQCNNAAAMLQCCSAMRRWLIMLADDDNAMGGNKCKCWTAAAAMANKCSSGKMRTAAALAAAAANDGAGNANANDVRQCGNAASMTAAAALQQCSSCNTAMQCKRNGKQTGKCSNNGRRAAWAAAGDGRQPDANDDDDGDDGANGLTTALGAGWLLARWRKPGRRRRSQMIMLMQLQMQ